MALSGKQIRHLRSLAHHLNPVVLIGKAGVTSGTTQQASEGLEAHELIKCGVQDGCDQTATEVAHELAELVGAEVVQVIGHRFSLYRPSKKKDIEHIKLPQ
ncbi:ribosome assembly RNA-binding protein YhbY [Collinsella sp. AGMB00827]|uniref:Ribosome assembly RNA-binding protein YhbY n=1 Tax=Collinsella ureilytica TaxID=2869515 RepID=A0ABS7MK92_9ACTN|nr:ribosome assembly RNA-binding protein YhbY [Collinsella urealyticum]MBY4797453.1 ribosome assembly RNA-binding protein YhbY [Collinsella urealyticum]